MSVFLVSYYVVKPDKQEEYKAMYRRWREYKKENPEEVKEIKSSKILTQTFGDIYGKYMEIHEFDSMADYERYVEKVFPAHSMGQCKGFTVVEASDQKQLMNTTMFWFPEMKLKYVPIYDTSQMTELCLKSKEKP